jgi:hypothetical protein
MPNRPKCLVNTATSGRWSHSTSCQLMPNYCRAVSANGLTGMASSCKDSQLGTTCRPSCHMGYDANSARCDAYTSSYGRWSPSPACSPKRYYCPTDSIIGCSRTYIGRACRPRCATGYTGSTSYVYCLAHTHSVGKWGYTHNPSATICSKRPNYCAAYRLCQRQDRRDLYRILFHGLHSRQHPQVPGPLHL